MPDFTKISNTSDKPESNTLPENDSDFLFLGLCALVILARTLDGLDRDHAHNLRACHP